MFSTIWLHLVTGSLKKLSILCSMFLTLKPKGMMLSDSRNLLIKLLSIVRPEIKASVQFVRNYSVKLLIKLSDKSQSTVLSEDCCLWGFETSIRWPWLHIKLCISLQSALGCKSCRRLKKEWMNWASSWGGVRKNETSCKIKRFNWFQRKNLCRRR